MIGPRGAPLVGSMLARAEAQRQGQRSARKKRRGPAELFSRALLESCSSGGGVSGGGSSSGVMGGKTAGGTTITGREAALPMRFASATEYYSSMRWFAIEEARSLAKAGLSAGGMRCDAMPVLCLGCIGNGGGGGGGRAGFGGVIGSSGKQRIVRENERQHAKVALRVLRATSLTPSKRRALRPGGMFLLQSDFSSSTTTRRGSNTSSRAVGTAVRLMGVVVNGSNEELGGVCGGHNVDGSEPLALFVFATQRELRMLGEYALCGVASAAAGSIGSGTDTAPGTTRYSRSPKGGGEQRWHATPLCSVLSQMRVYEACVLKPCPSWLTALLGSKTAQHTVFESSEDETDGEVESKSAGDGEGEGNSGTGSTDAAPMTAASLTVSLNTSQRAAVERFVGARDGLQLLQGPPGTGKTTTIVALLQAVVLARDGKRRPRVLVCAPSNKAVHAVLGALLRALWSTGQEQQKGFSGERWAGAGAGAGAGAESTGMCMRGLRLALAGVEDKLPAIDADAMVEDVADIGATAGPLGVRDVFVHTFSRAWTEDLARLTSALRRRVAQRRASAHPAPSASAESEGNDDEAAASFRAAAACRVLRLLERLECARGASNRVAAGCVSCLRAALVHLTRMDDTQQLAPAAQLLGDALACARAAGDSFVQAEEQLAAADVVFCTLITAGSSLVRRAFGQGDSCSAPADILIVDEAAQAVEAELCVALGCVCGRRIAAAGSKALLVGDPQQLSATVCSPVAAAHGYGRSALGRLMLLHAGSHGGSSVGGSAVECGMLTEQYRMHPAISRWPRQRFYAADEFTSVLTGVVANDSGRRGRSSGPDRGCSEAALRDAAIVRDRPAWPPRICTKPSCELCSPPASAHLSCLGPWAFIDCDSGQEHGGGSTSLSNASEATLVAELVTHLGTVRGAFREGHTCVVITFYTAQTAAITSALRAARVPRRWRVRVSTVDSFQGSEADIVILSFVRANARGSTGFLGEFRRLNVAVTRARHALLMVGHAATLARATAAATGNGADGKKAVHQADLQQQKHATDLAKLVQAARDVGAMFGEAFVRKYLKLEAAHFAETATSVACIRRARPVAEGEADTKRSKRLRHDNGEHGALNGSDERTNGDEAEEPEEAEEAEEVGEAENDDDDGDDKDNDDDDQDDERAKNITGDVGNGDHDNDEDGDDDDVDIILSFGHRFASGPDLCS